MKSDVKALVGKRVKSLRKGSRLTQEQLAEKANLHAKYISSLECGRENPTLDVFIKISNALGMVERTIVRQSAMLAANDIFLASSATFLLLAAFILLARPPAPEKA